MAEKRIHSLSNGHTPLVSVLLPVHNGESTIADAIDSILNQSYPHFELIIVNDHSSDQTSRILEKFAKRDHRIRILTNTHKRFLAGSLNRALKVAKGAFIARMDADDISLPARLEKQVAFLQKHKTIVACGGQEEIIHVDGSVVAIKNFPTDTSTCYRMILNFMVIQPPVLMARKSAMKRIQYDTGLAKHDDIDTHFQLLQYGQFGNVDEVIYQYRVSSHSYTFSDIKKVFFMALRVRLRAIRRYGYRPSIVNSLILLVETGTMIVLPNALLLTIFEWIRYSKTAKSKTPIPRLAFTRA